MKICGKHGRKEPKLWFEGYLCQKQCAFLGFKSDGHGGDDNSSADARVGRGDAGVGFSQY